MSEGGPFAASPAMPLVTVWFIEKMRRLWRLAEEIATKCSMASNAVIELTVGKYTIKWCKKQLYGMFVETYGVEMTNLEIDGGNADEIQISFGEWGCDNGFYDGQGGPICHATGVALLLQEMLQVMDELGITLLPFLPLRDADIVMRQFYPDEIKYNYVSIF